MYKVKILSNEGFDKLPYKRVKSSIGLADTKRKVAYIRQSGSQVIDNYLVGHELSHFEEEVPTHEYDDDGVRYKGGSSGGGTGGSPYGSNEKGLITDPYRAAPGTGSQSGAGPNAPILGGTPQSPIITTAGPGVRSGGVGGGDGANPGNAGIGGASTLSGFKIGQPNNLGNLSVASNFGRPTVSSQAGTFQHEGATWQYVPVNNPSLGKSVLGAINLKGGGSPYIFPGNVDTKGYVSSTEDSAENQFEIAASRIGRTPIETSAGMGLRSFATPAGGRAVGENIVSRLFSGGLSSQKKPWLENSNLPIDIPRNLEMLPGSFSRSQDIRIPKSILNEYQAEVRRLGQSDKLGMIGTNYSSLEPNKPITKQENRLGSSFMQLGKINPWSYFTSDANPFRIPSAYGSSMPISEEERKGRAAIQRPRLRPVSGAGGTEESAPSLGGSDAYQRNWLEGAEPIGANAPSPFSVTPRGMDIPSLLEGPNNPSSTYYGKNPNWATDARGGQSQTLEGLINPFTEQPLNYWDYKGFGIPETTSKEAFPQLPSLPRNTLIPGLGREDARNVDRSTTRISGPGIAPETYEVENQLPEGYEYGNLDPISRLIGREFFGIGAPKPGVNQLGIPLLDRFRFQGPMGTPKAQFIDAANQLAQQGLPIPRWMLENESGARNYREGFDSRFREGLSGALKVPNLSDPEQILGLFKELIGKRAKGPGMPSEPGFAPESEEDFPSPYPYTIYAGQETTPEQEAQYQSGLNQQREREISNILGQFRLFSPGATSGTDTSLAR